MRIYIPIAIGQTVPDQVIDSILGQAGYCLNRSDIVVCATPGHTDSTGEYGYLRRKGEASSREACRRAAIGDTNEYIVMQDRRSLHVCTDNFVEMAKFLGANWSYTGCALRSLPKTNHDHIRLACIMVRRVDFVRLQLAPVASGCMCVTIQDQLRKFGGYDYLMDKIRVQLIT